jgi:hypothetical protein
LTQFKRFTDLTVKDIPESARLVIMAGPNGSGKSSFFDSLYAWHRQGWKGVGGWDETYHNKVGSPENVGWHNAVQIEFYGEVPEEQDERKKAIYVRSAYRNDPEFQIGSLPRTTPLLQEDRFSRLIDNDAAVAKNYQRMASQGLEDVFEKEDPNVTIGQFRKKTIGEIRTAMKRLFPDLVLNSLGNPLVEGTFRFDKGISKGFLYKNLSGGEKAAFDLILDLIIKRREFDNTVFCIDEPEAHMNTRLQGALLRELYQLVPDGCQLWLATHSIGMMRCARDLSSEFPGTVVFIDFGDRDFDEPQVMTPVEPTRPFWQRVLNVALDDLADLIAPSQVVICEGAPEVPGAGKNAAMDSSCYDKIFESEFPDTKFISAGNAHQVESDRIALIGALKSLVQGAKVIRLIDRDDHSEEDADHKKAQGIHVLSRRNLECYLFDDEVLTKLCEVHGRPEEAPNLLTEKVQALANAAARGKAPDDLKAASGEIYTAAKKRLGIIGGGNNAKAFMRSTLAPLVQAGMRVYDELRRDIFD